MTNMDRANDRSWLFVARFGQFTIAFCYLIGAITGKCLIHGPQICF